MKASTQKQLNIRSDEAHNLAHDLARRNKTSATDVVVQALRRYAISQVDLGEKLPQAVIDENYRRMAEARKKLWGGKEPPENLDFSADFLYDDDGLPK